MRDQDWESRDPGEILANVRAGRPFRDGEVLLVLVLAPFYGPDAIAHITALPRKRWAKLPDHRLAELLRTSAAAMPVPARDGTSGRARPLIMTVIPRRGFVIFGADEARWLEAWMYSGHCTDASTYDTVLITEHGWTEFMSGWGGYEPRLAS